MSNPTDAHAAETHAPLAVLGVYQLLERVGAGGLGEVFRARDTVHGRTVAVKRVPAAVASDTQRAAALREACAALSHVSHPGIAMLYECGDERGELFVAQEFAPGQTLAQLLAGRAIHPRRAVEIALEAADALAALHAAGLVHGDLRPDTVVVTPKGHVKLLDAGLAAFTGGGTLRATAASRLGSLPADSLGVLRYLAPEQALGEGAGPQSDVFSLGAILYEMLTGVAAFDRPTPDETIMAVLRAAPSPGPGAASVPVPLARIVNRALSKPLQKRHASMNELAADLRAARAALDPDAGMSAAGSSAPAREPSEWSRESEGRRNWWVIALLGGGVAGVGWWLFGLVS